MTIPSITPLPPAPSRADAPDDWVAKADARVAAEATMVDEINVVVEFVEQRATAANDSSAAAAQSASAAAQAGTTAADSASVAEAAAQSAVVAAQAAQSAAGLPDLGGAAGKVLRVAAGSGGVEWSDLDSVYLPGEPTVDTPQVGASGRRIINVEYLQSVIAGLLGSAPAALDTLNELAAALGDDPNFSATVIAALAEKQPRDATLTALAALATAADRLIYATGSDAFSTTPLTAFGRSILAGVDAAAVCQLLGVVGAGQSYTNLTASRAFDTLYTNSTGRWRFVIVTPVAAASKTYSIEVGGSAVGGLAYGSATVKSPMFFAVQPGATYRITTTGTPSLENWQEA